MHFFGCLAHQYIKPGWEWCFSPFSASCGNSFDTTPSSNSQFISRSSHTVSGLPWGPPSAFHACSKVPPFSCLGPLAVHMLLQGFVVNTEILLRPVHGSTACIHTGSLASSSSYHSYPHSLTICHRYSPLPAYTRYSPGLQQSSEALRLFQHVSQAVQLFLHL